MSSGFVSGGTTDAPIERDDEWLQAQKEIEATRRRKEEESRQDGGKTLYEVLQQNKAAKQEAFEESIRLKNQFRNLDEDEVEFLDSVLESTRAKEEAVKKETTEQLDIFRRQQEEADKALLSDAIITGDANTLGKPDTASTEAQWAINAKKRKRAKDKDGLKGVKLRKSSSTNEGPLGLMMAHGENTRSPVQKEETERDTSQSAGNNGSDVAKEAQLSPGVHSSGVVPSSKEQKPVTVGLGLAGYSSDDED